MAIALPQGKQQFFDANGDPAVGWKLYTYVAGTSTPKDTYTTYVGNVANQNPIVMDARGEAAIYWSGDYDVTLKTAADVTVWGPERLQETETISSGIRDDLDDSSGSSLVGFIQTGTGAVARTAQAKMRERISVLDFGAVGDGSTDDTAALQAAIDAVYATGGGEIFVPEGVYKHTGINIPQRVWLVGVGSAFVNPYVDTYAAPKGSVLFLATGSNTNSVMFRSRLTNNGGILEETTIGGRNVDARHGGGMVGIMVWGNRSTTADPPTTADLNTSGDGISIQGCRYVTLQNVKTMFCADDGVSVISYDYGTGALSSNNLMFYDVVSLSNAAKGFNLAFGDSSFTSLIAGFNGTDGVFMVGSMTWTGGASWNNLRYGVFTSGGTDTSAAVIVGVSAYDNDSNGFTISTGRAPALVGCVGRGNGRDTALAATLRCNFRVDSGAEGWNLVGCYAYARDQDNTMVSSYGFRIDNSSYSGSLDGCRSEGALTNDVSITTPGNMMLHGGGVDAYLHPPIRLQEISATPTTPSADTGMTMYHKANSIVFQFNDGGTTRYKYLPLDGTSVTWVHTTSAP